MATAASQYDLHGDDWTLAKQIAVLTGYTNFDDIPWEEFAALMARAH